MSRLTATKWRQVREEYEMTDLSLRQIGKKYKISNAAILKKSQKEGWIRYADHSLDVQTRNAMFDAVKPKKLNKKVTRGNLSLVKKINILAATRAQVIMRHRDQWVKIDQLQSCAFRVSGTENGELCLVVKDMEAAKLANLAAKTYEIIQRNEREAWNLERQGIEYQLSEQQMDRRRELIHGMLDGQIDIYRATAFMDLEGIPMPDFIKTILSRTPVQEKEPELQEIPVTELDKEYQETLRDIHDQKTKWLPEREAEIRAAKEEAGKKDVFVSRDKTGENSEYDDEILLSDQNERRRR